MKAGETRISAQQASILCVLEPIVSVLAGVLIISIKVAIGSAQEQRWLLVSKANACQTQKRKIIKCSKVETLRAIRIAQQLLTDRAYSSMNQRAGRSRRLNGW